MYVRRRLLLLAAGLLIAWGVVQLWPSGSHDGANPTSTSTVTALPPSSKPTGSASASATPTPAAPTTPAEGSATTVRLAGGSKACESSDVAMVPSVKSPQNAREAVLVDVAITSSAKKPCVFTPKGLDPLAVITHDGESVWDSSVCATAIVLKPVQLAPGWATTVQVTWMPRESGTNCSGDEPWLAPADYTLRVGTLGGEPGRADFTLVEPPPPPTPTLTPEPTPPATQPQPQPAPPATPSA